MTVIRTLSKLRDQRRERRLLAQGTLHVLGQRKRLRRLRAAGLDTREAERMLEARADLAVDETAFWGEGIMSMPSNAA